MLYNPPGVSAPSSVTIPEGQNEAVMPLTADGGATLRRWKIAVLGQAPGGEASVVVASQLADLEVAAPFFRFTFAPVAVDQGQAAEVSVKIDKDRDFEGPAKVELLGLPNEVSTSPKEFTKDSTEIVFPLETTANSPVGLHKTLICRAVVTAEGEPIVHMLGGGELRIQKPLLPKPAAEAAPPPPRPPTPEPQKPPEKRLSRLEQLRLEKTKTPQAAPEQK